jgi:hypothetical protein
MQTAVAPFIGRLLCLLLVMSLLVLHLSSCGGSTLRAPPPATTPTPTTQRILLVRGRVPESVTYNVLGALAVRKLSYGGPEWALQRLADEARTAGANAVIEVEITFAPSWDGWATPHGKGIAVRIISPSVEAVAKMPELKPVWW